MEPEEIKLSGRSISLMALDLASRVATVELDTNHDHESVDDIISSTLSRMHDCIFGDDDDVVVGLMQFLSYFLSEIATLHREAKPGLRLYSLGFGIVELVHKGCLISSLSPRLGGIRAH